MELTQPLTSVRKKCENVPDFNKLLKKIIYQLQVFLSGGSNTTNFFVLEENKNLYKHTSDKLAYFSKMISLRMCVSLALSSALMWLEVCMKNCLIASTPCIVDVVFLWVYQVIEAFMYYCHKTLQIHICILVDGFFLGHSTVLTFSFTYIYTSCIFNLKTK